MSVGCAGCSKHTCSLLSSWGLCSGPPGSLCYHWEFTEANFIWISFKLNPEIAVCYLSWSYSKPFRSDPGISALATLEIASCLFLNRNEHREGRLLHSWLTMSSWHSECLVNSFHNKTFLLDLSLRNVILVIIFQRGWENDPLWVGVHDALEWSLLCRIKSSMRAGDDSVFRSTGSSSRSPRLYSQLSRGSLQSSVTPVPGSPVLSSGLMGTSHTHGIQIYIWIKHLCA